MRADLEILEQAIGHRFADRELLVRALTHSSYVHEKSLAGTEELLRDNEQFEFLGDSVLGFLIGEWLVKCFPDYQEGRLSKVKAHFVSRAHLYEVARRLDLGSYLQVSRGEEMSGGRGKRTLLGDALEALIAALYLDGGMPVARQFVETSVLATHGTGGPVEIQVPEALVDFRSALQELTQARKLPPPRYATVGERGPEHSKTFVVEVRVGREWMSQGEGFTKKSAAQKAARDVYERISAAP